MCGCSTLNGTDTLQVMRKIADTVNAGFADILNLDVYSLLGYR